MRWTADLRRRRIWFQVHFVDGEDEVVAVGTEVERVITGHFEILIKDLLVIGEKGKAGGKRRNQERQESNAESHGYRGQTVKDWWKQKKEDSIYQLLECCEQAVCVYMFERSE